MTGGHAHHSQGNDAPDGPGVDARYLGSALALIVVFMAAEVVVGVVSGSLALISDAGHMLTDAAAIALALVAARLSARPPKGNLTYGLRRVEILSAQANGITLWLLAAWLGYEAVRRLIRPPEVEGGWVLVTALAGIAVDVAATWLIGRANRTSFNVEGAFQHLLNDLYAFLGTAVAGLVIVLTGRVRAARTRPPSRCLDAQGRLGTDAGLLADLPRSRPCGHRPRSRSRRPHAVAGVAEVHDLHIWEVTSGLPAMSAHILVGAEGDCHERRQSIAGLVSDRYGIDHSTLQLDHPATPDLIEAESLLDAARRPPSGAADARR